MRFFSSALLLVMPPAALAQEVAVKSIPVATGSQFLLHPSSRASMGSVTIALADALADPYVNPAKGADIRGSYFASTPHFYSIGATSNPQGHATRTLPISAMLRSGRFYGGMTLAWQEMVRREANRCCVFFAEPTDSMVQLTVDESSSTTRNNLYVSVLGGVQISEQLSIGLSAFRGNLKGIEGVQLLYSQGDDVDQHGRIANYKIGLHQRWNDGRTAELVLQHHRFKMSHAMTALVWDDDEWHTEERLEQDETNGVALRLGYTQPMHSGWTAGVRLVGDWKSHPKIPNYDLMQIPRDPGNTGAYNIGVGLSRVVQQTTYAFEVIYEPIRSHTWANAEEDILIDGEPSGVKAGDMTVENHFRFHNSRFRMGVHFEGSRFDFGLGLDLHLIRYRLEQQDFVRKSRRALNEAWGEWTLTAGLGYRLTGFTIRYLSILTLGTGQPGLALRGAGPAEFLSADASFVVAPAGALDLIDARVWTHRISLILPLAE